MSTNNTNTYSYNYESESEHCFALGGGQVALRIHPADDRTLLVRSSMANVGAGGRSWATRWVWRTSYAGRAVKVAFEAAADGLWAVDMRILGSGTSIAKGVMNPHFSPMRAASTGVWICLNDAPVVVEGKTIARHERPDGVPLNLQWMELDFNGSTFKVQACQEHVPFAEEMVEEDRGMVEEVMASHLTTDLVPDGFPEAALLSNHALSMAYAALLAHDNDHVGYCLGANIDGTMVTVWGDLMGVRLLGTTEWTKGTMTAVAASELASAVAEVARTARRHMVGRLHSGISRLATD